MTLQTSVLAMWVVFLLVTATPAVSQKTPGTSTTSLRLTQCALKVSGMSCGGCAGMVERGLLKLEGVKEAKAGWKSGDVKVKYDKKATTPEKIVTGFNKENRGFGAELPKPKGR